MRLALSVLILLVLFPASFGLANDSCLPRKASYPICAVYGQPKTYSELRATGRGIILWVEYSCGRASYEGPVYFETEPYDYSNPFYPVVCDDEPTDKCIELQSYFTPPAPDCNFKYSKTSDCYDGNGKWVKGDRVLWSSDGRFYKYSIGEEGISCSWEEYLCVTAGNPGDTITCLDRIPVDLSASEDDNPGGAGGEGTSKPTDDNTVGGNCKQEICREGVCMTVNHCSGSDEKVDKDNWYPPECFEKYCDVGGCIIVNVCSGSGDPSNPDGTGPPGKKPTSQCRKTVCDKEGSCVDKIVDCKELESGNGVTGKLDQILDQLKKITNGFGFGGDGGPGDGGPGDGGSGDGGSGDGGSGDGGTGASESELYAKGQSYINSNEYDVKRPQEEHRKQLKKLEDAPVLDRIKKNEYIKLGSGDCSTTLTILDRHYEISICAYGDYLRSFGRILRSVVAIGGLFLILRRS